jgi:hypothetical protein
MKKVLLSMFAVVTLIGMAVPASASPRVRHCYYKHHHKHCYYK